MDVPAQEVREKEFTLPQSFCSLLALKGLHDARPQGEDRSSVLSLLLQTITSPGNVPQTQKYVLPAVRVSLPQSVNT